MTLLRREFRRTRYMPRMMALRSSTTPPTTPPTIAPIGFGLEVDGDVVTSAFPTERQHSTHDLWLDKELFNQPLSSILFASVASNAWPVQLVAEEVNVRLQS